MKRGGPVRLGPGAEFDLIRRFVGGGRAGAEGVRVGPGDDCAVVAGEGIALSSDLSVEGIHFRREWLSPEQVGWRAASAALSDLAAVAARAIGVLASLAIPEAEAGELAVRVMEGVRLAAESVGGVVLGGDLSRSPGPLILDVTVVGEAAAPVLRSGARPGDELWVTGELGGSGIAVARLLRGEIPHPDSFERFARPVPRVWEARWLLERGVPRAMVDLSDGLAGDAAHIAAASGVAVLLDRSALPVHPAVLEDVVSEEAALAFAVSGGEDYEICFAAAPGATAGLREEFEAEFSIRLTRVGRVEEGAGLFWLDERSGRSQVGQGGFQHFG